MSFVTLICGVGFLNLLVHLYADIDNQRIYESIHTDLSDLDGLRQQVAAWLQ